MKLFKRKKDKSGTGETEKAAGKKKLTKKKLIVLIAAVLLLLAAAAAAVLFFFGDRLFSRGEGPEVEEVEPEPEPEPVEAPVQYTLGAAQILALPTGEHILVYEAEPFSLLPEEEEPEKSAPAESEEDAENADAEEAQDEEEKQNAEEEDEESPVALAYRYEGLKDAAGMVSAYADLLTTEDMGFLVAGEDLKETAELPDFTAETGTVYLTCVLPKSEEDTVRQAAAMRLEWADSVCGVALELVPASAVQTPKQTTTGIAQTLTYFGAIDSVKAMHPSVLELEGDSMEDYRIYSRDATVLINDQPCMQLDVYEFNEEQGTNMVAGSYYLSSDSQHLYRFDAMTQTVRELPMNGNQPAAVRPDTPEESAEDTDSASAPESAVS